MQVGVLGPLRLVVGGREVPIGSARRRAVLALLVRSANQIVSIPRLVDAIWGEHPPGSAQNLVHTYVWRLRTLLAQDDAERLVTQPAGYLLRIGPEESDLARFEHLVARGRAALAAGEAARAEGDLLAAVGLWRGEPFEDVILHDGDHAGEIQRLAETRASAREDLIEAGLLLGRHESLVDELRQLTLQHPLRERAAGQLMLACYRAGRQADALAAYRRVRAALARDVGAHPGQALQDLHVRILRSEPELSIEARAPVPATAHHIVPRQLPHSAGRFIGRTEPLRALAALLERHGQADESDEAAVVCVIDGTAGVGKTTLALHWGRLNLARFPDGQLYADLRGFTPGAEPVTTAEALRGFLDALGVSPDRIPQDIHAQAALYRSLVAGKQMLVVLDNARDSDHVRPLLPGSGSPTTVTLVTSRSPLAGLIATAGARRVALALFTVQESRELLAGRLGPARTGAQPDAINALIEMCARLPLALALAAARATADPTLPLAALAAELRDARGRLDALDLGDGGTDLRTVFSCSYRTLDPVPARIFRLLGLHPGPEISVPATASLAAVTRDESRTALESLARANLVSRHSPGRYTVHDLLRAYSSELTHREDPEDIRRKTTHRILEHYLHTARAASLLIDPSHEPKTPPADHLSAVPETETETFTDREHAAAWFAAERAVLVALLRHAEGAGFAGHTVQLATAVATYFEKYGHWHEQTVAHEAALAAATSLGDRRMQAYAHRILGYTQFRLHRFERAHVHYQRSLTLLGASGDQTDLAHTHYYIAFALQQQGLHAQALAHAEQAMSRYRATGHSRQAQIIGLTGVCHAGLGDHETALAYAAQSLALCEDSGDLLGRAMAWWCLGLAHHGLGHQRQAIGWYGRVAELHRSHGDRHYFAEALVLLGDAHRDANDPTSARAAWQHALEIFDELGHPHAERIRDRLRHPLRTHTAARS